MIIGSQSVNQYKKKSIDITKNSITINAIDNTNATQESVKMSVVPETGANQGGGGASTEAKVNESNEPKIPSNATASYKPAVYANQTGAQEAKVQETNKVINLVEIQKNYIPIVESVNLMKGEENLYEVKGYNEERILFMKIKVETVALLDLKSGNVIKLEKESIWSAILKAIFWWRNSDQR